MLSNLTLDLDLTLDLTLDRTLDLTLDLVPSPNLNPWKYRLWNLFLCLLQCAQYTHTFFCFFLHTLNLFRKLNSSKGFSLNLLVNLLGKTNFIDSFYGRRCVYQQQLLLLVYVYSRQQIVDSRQQIVDRARLRGYYDTMVCWLHLRHRSGVYIECT